LVLAVSGMAVCGALATGPGLAFATAAAAGRGWGTAQELPGIAALVDGGPGAYSGPLSCSSPGNCAVGGASLAHEITVTVRDVRCSLPDLMSVCSMVGGSIS